MSDTITIRHELQCGDLGRLISLHSEAYEPLGGYGLGFEAFVSRTVAEFFLDNNANGRVWLAERAGELVGCSAISLRDGDIAQLRWLVVDPSTRGNGLGHELVERSLAYAREQQCRSVVLETTDSLPVAQALYENLGFRITSSSLKDLWGDVRPAISMQLDLA